MPQLACLQADSASAALAGGVFMPLVGLVLLALAAAAAVSPLVRARYRARVARLMALDEVLPRPDAWWQRARRIAAPVASSTSEAATRDAADWRERVRRVERRLTRATLVAWAAFALFAAALAGVLGRPTSLAMRAGDAAVLALFAVGPALANLPGRWSRRALGLGTAALAAAVVLGTAFDPVGDDGLLAFATTALVLAAICIALLHPSLRGQVLPLFVVMTVAGFAFIVAALFVVAHLGDCAVTTVPTVAYGANVVVLVLSLPAIWIGFRALGGLLWLGERGWFSDVSLPSFAALGVGALVWVAGAPAMDPDRVPATLAGLPVLWLAVVAVAYAVALGRRAPESAAPQLLMLRVFARRSRQYALLDALQQRWRCLGAVHQIGGPDLAAFNVDLDECAMYLTGRLHELFLPEAMSAERLRSVLRTGADREGRFRINEVFCFNTAWRATVEQLMRLSDAVVLDLRGFTQQRRGTAYEIGLLGHAALLTRVVAIGDGATNWGDVDALLRDAGADPAQLARSDERDGVDALFDRLLAVAAR